MESGSATEQRRRQRIVLSSPVYVYFEARPAESYFGDREGDDEDG
jgi:hypothetical protein